MQSIFNISTEEEFLDSCLEMFSYQYQNIEVYNKFVDYLGVSTKSIHRLEQIPFLPIEMFKNHKVLDHNTESQFYFQSSGTTQENLSKHWIVDESTYQESIYRSFSQFIGVPEEFVFLGLLPSYLERKNASLIYMVDFLMKKSHYPENGYFLYNHAELLALLQKLEDQNRKVILFGVSFALLDFLDFLNAIKVSLELNNTIVIETGGMKGRKDEMTKDELLAILQNGFGTHRIYSEYSMTELLSQAYSLGNNEYACPPWMRVLIRSIEDPLSYLNHGKTGAINIIDLANKHSCSFIATQDLGKIHQHKFQVLGRIDHSDIRGCSLLIS